MAVDPTTSEAARTTRAAVDPPAALVDLGTHAVAEVVAERSGGILGVESIAALAFYRDCATAVLAALLAASEVRAQFGYRLVWSPTELGPEPSPGVRWLDLDEASVREIAESVARSPDAGQPPAASWELLRRLVLVLPDETIPTTTEPIEEGQSQ